MDAPSPPPPDGRPIADRRRAFKRRTRAAGRDEQAERAFIEGKMAMVRSDPRLTDAEKARALEELQRKLERPPR
jgi:hypothetical protein